MCEEMGACCGHCSESFWDKEVNEKENSVVTTEKIQVINKIKEIESLGCSCEPIIGWSCGFHQLIKDLKYLLREVI